MVDWLKVALTLFRLTKKEEPVIAPEHIEVEQRTFSDENLLKGLGALRTVLSFIPPAQIVPAALTLGEVGFKVWKMVALRKEYEVFAVPPMGLNTLSYRLTSDPVLNEHFGHLVEKNDWGTAKQVVHDFMYSTDADLLQEKYPQLEREYLENICHKNQAILGNGLELLERQLVKHRHIPEVDQNLAEAVEALKVVFPKLRNTALLKSGGFDQVVEILDHFV